MKNIVAFTVVHIILIGLLLNNFTSNETSGKIKTVTMGTRG